VNQAPKVWAGSMAGLLAAYLGLVAWRGLALIRVGGVFPVALGLAVLLLIGLGCWLLVREWQFGRAAAQMGAELAALGLLPRDDLPRTPSGRARRPDADARFLEVRSQLETGPDSWADWFALSVAYEDAGDRRRARAALRRAALTRRRAWHDPRTANSSTTP
jgi:hypothetical protein